MVNHYQIIVAVDGGIETRDVAIANAMGTLKDVVSDADPFDVYTYDEDMDAHTPVCVPSAVGFDVSTEQSLSFDDVTENDQVEMLEEISVVRA